MLAAAALVGMSGTASAALNIYESFNYSTGPLQGNVNSGGGTANGNTWLQAGTSNPPAGINVTSGNLTGPAALPPSAGNDLSISHVATGDGSTNRLAIGQNYTTSSGTLYYSFLLNVTDLTNSNNTTGAFFLAPNNTGNSSQTTNPSVTPGKVQVRMDPTDGTKYDLGVFGQGAVTSGAANWSSALDTNTTQFIVASVNPGTKVFNLWINPDSSSFGLATAPTVTETLTDSTTWSGNNIQSMLLRQSLLLPSLTLDELRVGGTWADVTPTLSAYWDLNGSTTGSGGPSPSGTWDGTSTNWSTSSTGDASTQAWLGASYKAVFSAGTDATGPYTVTVSGTQNATALSFEEGTVTLTGGTVNLSSGVIAAASGVTATVESAITGSTDLIKNGAGTVILSGSTGYTGDTTISAGTLVVGEGGTTGALPTTSAITDNGTLAFNRSNAVTQGTDFSGSGISGTGNLAQAGTNNLTLNVPNTLTGVATATAGTLTVADSLALQNATVDTSGGGSIVFNNALTSATVGGLSGANNYSANSAMSLTIQGNVRNSSFGGVISGTGSVTMDGTICQELNGVNTYSGGTNVNGGILQFGATNSMPASGAVVVNSGGVLAVHVGGTGEWNLSGSGAGTINGLIAGDGGQTAGQVTWNDGSSLGINTQPVGTTTDTADLTFSGNIGNFNGVSDATKSVGFMKRGYGTLTLTGNNTFHGQLQVANEGGTLRLMSPVPNAGQSMTIPTVYIGNAQGTDDTILKILTDDALPSNSLINFGSSTTGSGTPKTRLRLHDEAPVSGSLPSASYKQTVRGISGSSGLVEVGGGTLTISTPTSESYASSATYISQADSTWNAGSWDANGARLGGHGTIIKTSAGEQDMNQFDTSFEGEFDLQQGTIGVGNDQIFGGVGSGSTRSQLTLHGGTLKNITGSSVNLRVPLLEMDGSFGIDVNGNSNFQFLGTSSGAFQYLRSDPTITITNSVANGTGVAIFLGQVDDGTFLSSTATHGFTKGGPGVLTLGSNLNSYRGNTVVQEGELRLSTSVASNSQVVSNLGDQTNPGKLVMAGGTLEINGQIGSVWNAGLPAGVVSTYNGTRTNIETNPIHVEAANDNSTIAYTSTTNNVTDDINFVFTTNSVDWTSGALTFLHNGASQGATFKPTFTGSGFNYAGPVAISNGGGTRKTVLTSTNSSGTQTWSGNISGDGSYTRSGAGSTVLSGANTYTGDTTVNGGQLTVTHSFRTGNSMNVADGARAVMAPRTGASANVLQVNTLNLNSTGTLDLNDNDLVVNNGDFATIQNLVFSGYRQSADPSATGIVSSAGQTAAGNPILAVVNNALIGSSDYPFGSGQTVSASAVLGKYTYFGDTNLDGQVTADDYGALDANFGTTGVDPGVAWIVGDTNFDGTVTADDYGTLDANFGLGVGNPLGANGLIAANGVAAVPEPAAMGLIGLAGILIGRRGRKRQHV